MMKVLYRFRKLSFVVTLLLLPYSILATTRVGRFKPIEIPVSHSEQGIKNIWDDVSVTTIFKAPDGAAISVNVF